MSIRTTEQQTKHILALLQNAEARRRQRRSITLRMTAAAAVFCIVCGGILGYFGFRGTRYDGDKAPPPSGVLDESYGDFADGKPDGMPDGDADFSAGNITEEPGEDGMTGEISYADLGDAYLRNLLGEPTALRAQCPLFSAESRVASLTADGRDSSLTLIVTGESLSPQTDYSSAADYLQTLAKTSQITVTALPYQSVPAAGLSSAVTPALRSAAVDTQNGALTLTLQLADITFPENEPFFFLLRFETGETLLDCAGVWYLP